MSSIKVRPYTASPKTGGSVDRLFNARDSGQTVPFKVSAILVQRPLIFHRLNSLAVDPCFLESSKHEDKIHKNLETEQGEAALNAEQTGNTALLERVAAVPFEHWLPLSGE